MRHKLLLLLPLLLILTACPQPPEKTARDAIAAGSGAIKSAQAKYQPTCVTDPHQQPCVLINKAIFAHQSAITALQAYCGFTSTTPVDAKCQPVQSLIPALQSAVNNLNQFTQQLQGVLGTTGTTGAKP